MHTTVLPPIDRMAQIESDHRIANNLGLLAALLELDGGTAEDAGAPGTAELLHTARRRIYAVANIHRRLYQTDREGWIDLSSYLNDLGNDLRTVCQDTGRRRHLTIHTETRYLSAEHAISVGILVAELVGNAYKHAYLYDQPGEVRIVLENRPLGWQLTVEDDGVGFARSPERTAARMGAHLIDASATRLGALYVWQDTMPGTRFILWKEETVSGAVHPAHPTMPMATSATGARVCSARPSTKTRRTAKSRSAATTTTQLYDASYEVISPGDENDQITASNRDCGRPLRASRLRHRRKDSRN